MTDLLTKPTIEYRGNPCFFLGVAWEKQMEAIALEVYGPEATVSALCHHLVKYEMRNEPFKTETLIHDGMGGTKHIALTNGKFRFKPAMMVNGAARWCQMFMFADKLRPSNESEFYFFKNEHQPDWFFKRLSNVSPIPLRPEWAEWLWRRGEQWVRVKYINPGGMSTDKKAQPPFIAEETITPIARLAGDGIDVYKVNTKGTLDEYKLAWMEIIWAELNLKEQMFATSTGYGNATLEIGQVEKELVLTEKKSGKELVRADNLEWLVTKARMAGVPLELR